MHIPSMFFQMLDIFQYYHFESQKEDISPLGIVTGCSGVTTWEPRKGSNFLPLGEKCCSWSLQSPVAGSNVWEQLPATAQGTIHGVRQDREGSLGSRASSG